jgi:hypothetical protein
VLLVRTWFGTAILVALVIGASARSVANSPSVNTNWSATPSVIFALTPNYASGCGTVKAVFGTQPTPAPPSQGCMAGGPIDFGTVTAGDDYLYKYAAHLNVQTNDVNGVNIYGEGAADFFNTNDSTSVPLDQAVYWLASTSGGSDANTGFSASTPFFKTSGSVANNSPTTTPTITYSSYPTPIGQTASDATADFYYDYQLKIPLSATFGAYYVWIVYTVVAK